VGRWWGSLWGHTASPGWERGTRGWLPHQHQGWELCKQEIRFSTRKSGPKPCVHRVASCPRKAPGSRVMRLRVGRRGDFHLPSSPSLVAGGGDPESQGKPNSVNKRVKKCSRGRRGEPGLDGVHGVMPQEGMGRPELLPGPGSSLVIRAADLLPRRWKRSDEAGQGLAKPSLVSRGKKNSQEQRLYCFPCPNAHGKDTAWICPGFFSLGNSSAPPSPSVGSRRAFPWLPKGTEKDTATAEPAQLRKGLTFGMGK